MMHEAAVDCPYCGERFVTLVDTSAGDQCYVEDCQVCCQPIVLSVSVDKRGDLAGLEARREND